MSEATKAAAPVTYPVARAATAVLTAGAFFVIFAVIGLAIAGTLTLDVLQLKHARFMMAIGLGLAAFFAGHGGAIGLLDGYSQGRFQLPPVLDPPPSAARAENPWRVALGSAGLVGAPLGALAFWAVPLLWPSGVARGQFVWCFAASGSLVSAGIVWFLTGQRFLREAQLPAAQRRFAGSHAAYLWQRHVLPQAIINAIINGWIGVALIPGELSDPAVRVPAATVLLDVRGSAFVLAAAIALGVRTHARFDVRWGVVSPLPAARPPSWWRSVLVFGSAPVLALAFGGLLASLGIEALKPWTFILGRGAACAVYCGGIAYWVARWNLR